MVFGVPVQRVDNQVKLASVEEFVDNWHDILAVVASRTVADCQRPTDKVILHVHNHQCCHRVKDLEKLKKEELL